MQLKQMLKKCGNYFDFIVASEVIEHIFDTDFFISELKRSLKPGGIGVISTPNIVSLNNRIRIFLGKHPSFIEYRNSKDCCGHIRSYSYKKIKEQVEEHDLKVLELISPNFPFPYTFIQKSFMRKILVIFPFFQKLGDYFPGLGTDTIIIFQKLR